MVLKQRRQMKILDEKRRLIGGWASVEVLDSQGDIVPTEELEKAMLFLMDRGGHIMYAHENKPVGKILRWDIRKHEETGVNGVWIIAKIFNDYPIDDKVWALIKQGKLQGFSIGAEAKSEDSVVKDEESGEMRKVSVLRDINLAEVSVVEEPANPFALIEEINFYAKSKKCSPCQKIRDILKGNEERYIMIQKVLDGSNEFEEIREILHTRLEQLHKVNEDQIPVLIEEFKKMIALLSLLYEKQETEEEEKGRVYVRNPAEAPEGAVLREGRRGGMYYETGEIRTRRPIGGRPSLRRPEQREEEEAETPLLRPRMVQVIQRCRSGDGQPAVAKIVLSLIHI